MSRSKARNAPEGILFNNTKIYNTLSTKQHVYLYGVMEKSRREDLYLDNTKIDPAAPVLLSWLKRISRL
jgi:hypothetical protein